MYEDLLMENKRFSKPIPLPVSLGASVFGTILVPVRRLARRAGYQSQSTIILEFVYGAETSQCSVAFESAAEEEVTRHVGELRCLCLQEMVDFLVEVWSDEGLYE